MFEHFSFSSPSSSAEGDDRLLPECDSSMISPLSSRCPSPSYLSRRSRPMSRPRSPYMRRPQPPPTSMPANYEQFQRRISVGTLTEKLNAHTLNQNPTSSYEPPLSPLSPTSFSFSVTQEPTSRGSVRTLLTPPGEYDFEDEGYDEQMTPGWEQYHNTGVFTPSPTSMPLPSDQDNLLLHPGDIYSHHRSSRQHSLRSQRQNLSRAQCNIDVLKLALMAEGYTRRTSESTAFSDDDCHPSSLPLEVRRPSVRPRIVSSSGVSGAGHVRSRTPRASPDLNDAMRRHSTSTGTFASSAKIHKPRLRDLHSKRSDQTLRRKSLVCATLAAKVYDDMPLSIPRSSSP